MSPYARAVDSNHSSIREGLRKLGVWVWDSSSAGDGAPDLVCWYRDAFYLLEIKPPLGPQGGASKSALTPAEEKFHRGCPGEISVVRSLEEALAAVGWEMRAA